MKNGNEMNLNLNCIQKEIVMCTYSIVTQKKKHKRLGCVEFICDSSDEDSALV